MTRLRSTRAATEDGSIVIQTSVRLMDDFIYASDIDAATDLIPVQDPGGGYTLLYFGATGQVMALRQDAASDTGWMEEALSTGISATQVAAAVDGSGNLVVFAVGSNPAQPDLYVATRSAAGTWSQWQPIALSDTVPPSNQATQLAAVAVNGVVELWTILGPSPNSQGFSSLWNVAWSESVPAWTQIDWVAPGILEPCTIAGTGAGLLVANTAAANPAALDLFTLSLGTSGATLQPLAQTVSLGSIAVCAQADENSAVFVSYQDALEGTCQIQYLDGGNPKAGFVTVDTATPAVQLLAASAGTTPLTLFALDSNNDLHLVGAPTSPASSDSPDFDFSLRFALATTVMDREGNAELVGYVAGKGLVRLWSNSEDGGWSQAAIEYQPVGGTLTQSSTYAATLAFYGANGVPLINQSLNLGASLVAAATIGGEAVLLGPAQPVAVKTDARGQVRVTMPADSLAAPQLSASLPDLMTADEDFLVSPDAGIKNRLASITAEEVAAFINPQFSSSATAIQQAVQETMANIGAEAYAAVRTRRNPRQDLKTPLPGGCGRAHSLSIRNGQAVFALLTPEQAEQRIAAMTDTTAAGSAADGGIFDFFGDALEAMENAVVEAVADGVDWVYDHVVQPVAQGIQVAIKFISDTVTVVWNGIIDTVDEAFRFVESVFDAFATFFDRLYNFFAWLLSGAQKDIWATKQYLDSLLTTSILELAAAATSGATAVDNFFTGLEAEIEQAFATIETMLGNTNADTTMDAGPSGAPTEDESGSTFLEIIEDSACVANWLFDKVSDMLGLSASFNGLSGSLASEAAELAATIGTTFVTQLKQLFQTFVENLQGLATSTTNFAETALATILNEVKDLLIAALKLLDSLVSSVLTFLGKNLPAIASGLLGAAVGGGLMQALYDAINPGSPEPLTLQGLGTVVIGFVTTILYKAITDDVPFSSGGETTALAGSAGNVEMVVAGLIQVSVWQFYDIMADAAALADLPGPASLYVAFGIIPPLTIQLLTRPSQLSTQSADARGLSESGDNARLAAWFTGFTGIMFNTFWALDMAKGGVKTGPRTDPTGAIGLCACGLSALGANIWSAIANEADGAGWVSAIASPLSAIIKPAAQIRNPEAALIILLITDTISNCGGGVAKMVMGQNSIVQEKRRMLPELTERRR